MENVVRTIDGIKIYKSDSTDTSYQKEIAEKYGKSETVKPEHKRLAMSGISLVVKCEDGRELMVTCNSNDIRKQLQAVIISGQVELAQIKSVQFYDKAKKELLGKALDATQIGKIMAAG